VEKWKVKSGKWKVESYKFEVKGNIFQYNDALLSKMFNLYMKNIKIVATKRGDKKRRGVPFQTIKF